MSGRRRLRSCWTAATAAQSPIEFGVPPVRRLRSSRLVLSPAKLISSPNLGSAKGEDMFRHRETLLNVLIGIIVIGMLALFVTPFLQ